MLKDKTRYDSFDLLKLICSLLIISLHLNPFPKEGIIYFLTRGIANIGVPVFFILSSFFFYTKINAAPKSEHKAILWRYIKRLLVLLAVWNLVYFFASDIWWIIDGNLFIIFLSTLDIYCLVDRVIFCGILYHLYLPHCIVMLSEIGNGELECLLLHCCF